MLIDIPRRSLGMSASEASGVEHVVRTLGETGLTLNRTHDPQRIPPSPARAGCNREAKKADRAQRKRLKVAWAWS